jgi:hypothetical protein
MNRQGSKRRKENQDHDIEGPFIQAVANTGDAHDRGPGSGRPEGSARFGANVTNFEASLRASGSAWRIMTGRSPDLAAYCSFGRLWREP